MRMHKGISGWLLVYTMIVVANVLIVGAGFVYDSSGWSYLVLLGATGSLLLSIIALFKICVLSINAPYWNKVLIVWNFILFTVLLGIYDMVTNEQGDFYYRLGSFLGFFVSTLWAGLWIAYWTYSVRVRQTFRRPHRH